MRFRARIPLFLFILASAPFAPVQARPLMTEEVATVGRHSFETTLGLSKRYDTFGDPEAEYDTVNFPIQARIGVTNKVDFGIVMAYATQRLQTEKSHFTGSQNGRFSPFLKISPWENLGFQVFWHSQKKEQEEQTLPVARGDDFEAIALLKVPVSWPVTLNVGYLSRGRYASKLGVNNGPAYRVEPGNIFESKFAVEAPLKLHFSLLAEMAYYRFTRTSVAGRSIDGSSGEAADALAGLTWAYNGWNLGFGASFGLLDERHTSFDLERGAGDVQYRAVISYKLTPRKPGS